VEVEKFGTGRGGGVDHVDDWEDGWIFVDNGL
jgi:hypothetical protein